MSDADLPPGAQARLWDGVDSLATSRRGLRDLAALLVLPTMWVDHDPAYIVAGLLDVLFGTLRLESGYVRFDRSADGPALERWRPDGPSVPVALGPLVSAAPSRERGAVTVLVTMPSGDGTIRVTSMSPALPGEGGLVLVGARRADFPTERELYLLRVAVGQAMIAIHTARRLASERAARVAAEAALRLRNAFLATLAQDLIAPLAALASRAAQAHACAYAAGRTPEFAGAVEGSPVDSSGASRPASGVSPHTPPTQLSRRQAEVLGLLAQGLSNREIAGILVLSERTVERHITGLYRKIRVERRSEATAFAMRHRLVDAGTYDG